MFIFLDLQGMRFIKVEVLKRTQAGKNDHEEANIGKTWQCDEEEVKGELGGKKGESLWLFKQI